MNWSRIAQTISDVLAIALIIRFLILRLHTVYRVFCLFLLWDLFTSSVAFAEAFAHNPHLDYRITWICTRTIAWALSLWMVYALLQAMLTKLPGILRISRRVLNVTFLVAIVLALLTAQAEYFGPGRAEATNSIRRALVIVFVSERVIAMAALLVLLSMLAFVLWFPVSMPRNLVVFSVGFVVYFAAKTALLLARSYLSPDSATLFSNILDIVLGACLACWLLFINAEGETAVVTVGHKWHPKEQQRLVGELQAMNTALSRAARR